MNGQKIRFIREIRGLSQENIATKLGIAQNSYSKIENNQVKLESKLLLKIAEVLEVSPMDILSMQPAIINFKTSASEQNNYHNENDSFTPAHKELFERLISNKDAEISRLNKIIEDLIFNK